MLISSKLDWLPDREVSGNHSGSFCLKIWHSVAMWQKFGSLTISSVGSQDLKSIIATNKTKIIEEVVEQYCLKSFPFKFLEFTCLIEDSKRSL